ncbi:uncharacterized protein LOC122040843 isoform X2 [Zingiber officinale]|uniref:uncharacterized protein LOC122040843 isoform X2 n=1 Tax=Zingiber officinale TaxID=94328 RepID=UPI001C4B4E02|nr:uncharacterized protein LOC122040843 isoform X2 [Zingiber officinale]
MIRSRKLIRTSPWQTSTLSRPLPEDDPLLLHISSHSIVIMEGDPHPGALKGRMSFQSFNPSIDKLNEEAANNQQNVATASNSYGDSSRVGEATAIGSREPRIGRSNNGSDVGLKRKQPEVDSNSTTPEEMLKIYSDQGKQSSSNNRTGSLKQQKRGKLDWNVLRPTTI